MAMKILLISVRARQNSLRNLYKEKRCFWFLSLWLSAEQSCSRSRAVVARRLYHDRLGQPCEWYICRANCMRPLSYSARFYSRPMSCIPSRVPDWLHDEWLHQPHHRQARTGWLRLRWRPLSVWWCYRLSSYITKLLTPCEYNKKLTDIETGISGKKNKTRWKNQRV